MVEQGGGGSGPESGGNGALTRQERPPLGKIARYLGFADFMAVLMVSATVFSGFATWRTAMIAQQLYRASERPYIGVQHVWMERANPRAVRVSVDYRDYGHVPAEDLTITERLLADGKPIPGAKTVLPAGIISPGVPHFVHVYLLDSLPDAARAGKIALTAIVTATYGSSRRRKHCYLERFKYLVDTDSFEADGGSPRCAELQQFEAQNR